MFEFSFRIKNGQIKGTLDWVQAADYEMISTVFSELNIVNEVNLTSERLSQKDLDKMEEEYVKELRNINLTKTKQSVWKYLKNSKTKNESEEKTEGEKK